MRSEKPNQVHRPQIRTATNRTQEYIQAARPIQQISRLLRVIRLLDEPRDVDSIATLLLVGLTAEDGLSCPRAVLLLLDPGGRQLRGHGAMGVGPEPRPRLEELLIDGLPEQVGPARTGRKCQGQKVREDSQPRTAWR